MATATNPVTPVLPWNDSYSVGIPQIDEQHKKLIKLINELHASMATGQGKQALGGILEELVRYTRTHFEFEESLLRQKNYSRLAAHHAVHESLTQQVVDLLNKYRVNNLILTLEVMQFLKRWLADHIMTHDQAYAKEFKTR